MRHWWFWVLAPVAVLGAVVIALGAEGQSHLRQALAWSVSGLLVLATLGLSQPRRFTWAIDLAATGLAVLLLVACAYQLWQKPTQKGLGAAVAWFLVAAWLLRKVFFPSIPPVLQHSPDDPLMLAAKEKARASLSTFRTLFQRSPSECSAKFPVLTDTGTTEYLWAQVTAWEGDKLTLQYLTPPVTQEAPMPASAVRSEAELVDWLVELPEGRLRGGFSHRAMLDVIKRDSEWPSWGLLRRLGKQERQFVDT